VNGEDYMFKGEITICSVVFFISLYLFTVAAGYRGNEIYGKLGPGFWPKLILLCMMALSAWIAVDAFRARKISGKAKNTVAGKRGVERIRFFSALLIMVGYFFLLNIVGFVALTPFFLVGFMILLGEKSWPWMVGLSVGMTALIVIAFTQAMYVPLPRGIGFFHTFSVLFY
jgi:putative tricarboxylic transport membrane protein